MGRKEAIVFGTRTGEDWKDHMKSSPSFRANLNKLRRAYRYVLSGKPLMPNQDAQAAITNAGSKLWSEKVHADILETILREFKNHKKYKYLLEELANYIGVVSEEDESELPRYNSYGPEREMMRRLLREKGLENSLITLDEWRWRH